MAFVHILDIFCSILFLLCPLSEYSIVRQFILFIIMYNIHNNNFINFHFLPFFFQKLTFFEICYFFCKKNPSGIFRSGKILIWNFLIWNFFDLEKIDLEFFSSGIFPSGIFLIWNFLIWNVGEGAARLFNKTD